MTVAEVVVGDPMDGPPHAVPVGHIASSFAEDVRGVPTNPARLGGVWETAEWFGDGLHGRRGLS